MASLSGQSGSPDEVTSSDVTRRAWRRADANRKSCKEAPQTPLLQFYAILKFFNVRDHFLDTNKADITTTPLEASFSPPPFFLPTGLVEPGWKLFLNRHFLT